MILGVGDEGQSFSTEHKHLDMNLKVAIYLFTKYTVSQKQLRFIHINFIIKISTSFVSSFFEE